MEEVSLVAQQNQDISIEMRIGNFKTDHQVRDLIKNSHSGSVMISRSSMEKVEDGSKHDAVCEEPDKHQNPTNRHNSASVSNGKKSRIINQVQQTSNETLLINKQRIIITTYGQHVRSLFFKQLQLIE